MLKIRLARWGKHKAPFYRVVLTESSKPAQCGYHSILGRYDPMNKKQEFDFDAIKTWISKWAQPSSRVAKMLYKESNDSIFQKFFHLSDRVRTSKKDSE
jgi:small subunit ribosomal protein S16